MIRAEHGTAAVRPIDGFLRAALKPRAPEADKRKGCTHAAAALYAGKEGPPALFWMLVLILAPAGAGDISDTHATCPFPGL